MACDICGEVDWNPYQCSYCGGEFCKSHRLPEKHNCSGVSHTRGLGPNVPGASRGRAIDPDELEIVEVSRGDEESSGLGFWSWLTILILVVSIALFAHAHLL